MDSHDLKWQFDLSTRPQALVERSASTIALASNTLKVCAHQTPRLARQAVVGSCLSFAIEQQNSAGLLVATGRDSSAAVLIRPILESLCISAWALYCAQDGQLTSVLAGLTRFPSLTSLVSQLELSPTCNWIGFKQKSANVNAFHALAHPSMLQLSKRYAPGQNAGAFTPEECFRLLWLADTLSITIVAVFSVAIGSDEIETWAGNEMSRLMTEQGLPWEHWGDLPRSTMPFELPTPLIQA